jgi:outer membrane protein
MENVSGRIRSGAARRPESRPYSFIIKGAVFACCLSLIAGGICTQAVSQSSLSLYEVLRLSLQNSSKIKSAEHDSLAASYACREAKSRRFPTISLSAASYYIDDLQSIHIPPMSMEIGSHENLQMDFKISVPLWTGGRISNQIKIRQANARATTSNLQAERLQIAYASRSAYFNLLAAQAIVKSAAASLKRVEILKQDVRNRFVNGVADSLDLLDVELALQEAIQSLADSETARRNISAALARLVGLPVDELIILPETVPAPQPPAETEPALDRIRRPELDSFDSRIEASEMLMRLNKSGYFPTISGYGGYSVGKPNRDLFNKTWNDYFSAGVALVWEFNTGGGVGHAAKNAEYQYFAEKSAKKDFEESLLLQAAISRQNLQHAFETYSISKIKYDIAAQKFRLAGAKHRAGNISINRLLELEAELAAMEQMVHASMSGFYIAETEFLYITGSQRIYGGF